MKKFIIKRERRSRKFRIFRRNEFICHIGPHTIQLPIITLGNITESLPSDQHYHPTVQTPSSFPPFADCFLPFTLMGAIVRSSFQKHFTFHFLTFPFSFLYFPLSFFFYYLFFYYSYCYYSVFTL